MSESTLNGILGRSLHVDVGNGVVVSRLGQDAQFRDDCSDPGER